MTWRAISLGAAIAAISFQPLSFPANAQGAGPSASDHVLSDGQKFVEKSGEALFANACQGCHMVDGKGATGAGTYPSLARNGNLESGGYPIAIVLNGQRAMPAFGAMMSDEQIAAVVNYVRTHFGNQYRDTVIAEDVSASRR
jgi:mono/diheme cytochrome c family protein